MKIELFFLRDCPNYLETRALLEDTLEKEGLAVPIEMVEVTTEKQAKELLFPGSPTIRLDGYDIDDDSAKTSEHGLRFRKYKSPNPRGIATRAIISQGVKRLLEEAKDRGQ